MANTLFVGKVYYHFDELSSTNDYAAELIATPSRWKALSGAAKSKPPEGLVIQADSQSAGRGQFGSRWQSAAGKNLTFSVVLYPTWLEIPAQFYLSMAMALALCDTVGIYGGEVSTQTAVKWPNDLYFGDRKAAGILIQNTLSGQYIQACIAGIGLNVNQLEFDPSLTNPTSMAHIFGRDFDLKDVAERLFECLERRYLQLKSGQRSAIKAEYEQHLYRLGQPSRFVRTADGSEFVGAILGVSDTGLLRMAMEKGEETFEVKGLKFVV